MARSGPSRTLKLRYVGDASDLSKANQEAEGSLQKLGAGFGKFAKAVAVGVAAAGAGILAFAKSAVDSAVEAEAAQTRLATILRNTGLATEDQVKALGEQATALEKVGVASASNITVLQAQLATFDLSADTIKTLTPAVVDYVIAEKGATASAADFQSAANGLAQALQGNFGSLSRTGFVLDDVTKELIKSGTEAERAAALVDVLSSTYAGFNEVARQTAEGQLVALRNSFDSLKEQIGGALLPEFNKLVGGASKLVERFQELWDVHGPAIIERFERLKERGKELYDQFRDALPGALKTLQESFDGTGEAFRNLYTAFGEFVGATVQELRERGSFNRLKGILGEIKVEIDLTIQEFNRFLNAVSGNDAEQAGLTFARIVELQYIKPIEFLGELVRDLLGLFQTFLNVGSAIAQLPTTIRNFGNIGKAFDLGDIDFFTGQVTGSQGSLDARRTVTNVINVTGAIDPEGTARVIKRTLDSSALRVGQVPTPGLAVVN